MPSGKKPKDSTILRQTTLFTIGSSSLPPKRSQGGSPVTSFSPTKSTIESNDSSEEDISGIHFAPIDKRANLNPIIISSDEEETSQVPSSSSKRRITRVRSLSQSEEEGLSSQHEYTQSKRHQSDSSEHDEPVRKKTRFYRHKSPETEITALADEVDEERILKFRLRERRKPKSVFQQNLDKLKKKKSKSNNGSEENEDNSANSEEDGDEDGDEEEDITAKPFRGSKPSVQDDDNIDDNDDDATSSDTSSNFIVEDDGSDDVQLPPEFSMETHEDISHQFKKIFQFFVHIAVQPSETRTSYMQKQLRDEQYFSVPLQVMRRKLSGLRDSLVSSSVWRPEFKKALESYPDLELVRLDFAVPACDACHLGGRMSTLLGRLSGSQYNEVGFEPRPSTGSEDDIQKEFHLGRFCARRTRTFHEFSHWEHGLFQNILREIDCLEKPISKRFNRIGYSGAQPPQDLKDADGLCDWLDGRRIIDMEWHKLKTMMESARCLEMDKGTATDE